MLITINKTLPILVALTFTALFSSDALAFGKKPVTPPPPPSNPAETDPPSGEVIRARWETKARDGAEWSQYAYDQIPVLGKNLLAKNPGDVAQFCPNYAYLDLSDKKNFWVYLLSAMSELESAHNPNSDYVESFKDSQGNNVISSGLLQLSVSDKSYGCAFNSIADVHDPHKNLDCGIRILNKWLSVDGVISGKSGSTWIGGARYWSVLRNKLTTIQGWTKAQNICLAR